LGAEKMKKELSPLLKKKKDMSVKDFIFQTIIVFLALGTCAGIVLGLEYLKVRVFSSEAAIVTVPIINGGFIILTFFIVIFIYSFLGHLLVKKQIVYTKKEIMFRMGPLFIIFTLVAILSFDQYAEIREETIVIDRFWSFETKEYEWDTVESAVVSEGYRRVGNYTVYFQDGTKLNFWGGTRIDIYDLKTVDDLIKEKNIPKYINSIPTDKRIKRMYKKPETYEIVKTLFSE
jgi:hypothetical protein